MWGKRQQLGEQGLHIFWSHDRERLDPEGALSKLTKLKGGNHQFDLCRGTDPSDGVSSRTVTAEFRTVPHLFLFRSLVRLPELVVETCLSESILPISFNKARRASPTMGGSYKSNSALSRMNRWQKTIGVFIAANQDYTGRTQFIKSYHSLNPRGSLSSPFQSSPSPTSSASQNSSKLCSLGKYFLMTHGSVSLP